MTVATQPMPDAPPHRPLRELTPGARTRAVRDRLMHVLLLGALLVAVAPLIAIIAETVRQGSQAMGVEFLTSVSNFSRRRAGGGYLHGFVGTLYMTGIAALITVPLGILAAIFLVEYRRSMLATAVRFFTDVMTGVPSIFVGLFVYSLLVRQLALGFGTFAGGVALAIVMLPIMVRSGEEMLKLVPDDLRAASLALGARRWQTIIKVVVPAAGPGLVTGGMLAVARGAGETAPLLLTALGANALVFDLQGRAQSALPLLIFDDARVAFAAGQANAWAGALQLITVVLVLTVAARVISARGGHAR